MEKYTREDLINICVNSVVSFHDWNNRDSYSAQCNVEEIYRLLKADAPFEITSIENKYTIWLRFEINDDVREKLKTSYESLPIDSREDYFEEYGYDNEMFDCFYLDINIAESTTGYLPTWKRLKESEGGDWY